MYREILLRKGVPAARIRLFGNGIASTADEALTFSREYPAAGKRVLVVTSRYHARRARMIFRRFLPQAEVRVAATPYEPRRARWWKDKFLAEEVFLEAAKTVYYLFGGMFVGPAKRAA